MKQACSSNFRIDRAESVSMKSVPSIHTLHSNEFENSLIASFLALYITQVCTTLYECHKVSEMKTPVNKIMILYL